MDKFERESLEFWLRDDTAHEYRLPNAKYVLDVLFNEDVQKSWKPQVGDLFATHTGNIYVISGDHNLTEELGGRLFFFGGGMCTRGDGCIMDETYCYTMNKDGLSWHWGENGKRSTEKAHNHSAISKFRWIPRVGEYKEKLPSAGEYFASITDGDEYKDLPTPIKLPKNRAEIEGREEKYKGKLDHDVRGWQPK